MAPTDKKPAPSDDDDPSESANRSRANLVALAFIVVLFVGAYWLFTELQRHRAIEDCIASGRHDCIPLTPTDGH
jgi:hypothetical protein